MLTIKKQQGSYALLQLVKEQKIQTFEELPTEVKRDLKEKLLVEQHFICAYCMKKITYEKMKVEHFLPQSLYPEQVFVFKNLFAVCLGIEHGAQTCDTSKANEIIDLNPLNATQIATISYGATGMIRSENPSYNQNLNQTLNLNTAELIAHRRNVRNATIKNYQKFKTSVHMRQRIARMKHDALNKARFDAYLGVKIAIFDKILLEK
ncbi:MAG: retron system putative HNH endonuclease [Culicoidibacterales bacterium]